MGSRCELCTKVNRLAWPLLSWDEFLSQAKSSETFTKIAAEARQVIAGEKKKTFADEYFSEGTLQGYRVERELSFYTLAQLESEAAQAGITGLKPQHLIDAGFVIEKIVDENGKEISGAFLDPGKPRKVILYHDTLTNWEKKLHQAQPSRRPLQSVPQRFDVHSLLCFAEQGSSCCGELESQTW